MLTNVKDLTTGELLYEKLEVEDIVLGATRGDNRVILLLPGGEKLIFSPSNQYEIWRWEPEPPAPPEPETEAETEAEPEAETEG